MRILVLGRGKTGALVAEVARQRGHEVIVVGSTENAGAHALTPRLLADTDVVIDFTAPQAVVPNIEACLRGGTPIVVGTTGWYQDLPRIRQLAGRSGTGFVYGSNFSLGVNLFFELARLAAPLLSADYQGKILERHHIHKKDAPSGTAVMLQKVVHDAAGAALPITSEREGEVVGFHSLSFDCASDTITLSHDAKSRRGFAEGAVRAAEWLRGRKGFYDFRDIFRDLGKPDAKPKARTQPGSQRRTAAARKRPRTRAK